MHIVGTPHKPVRNGVASHIRFHLVSGLLFSLLVAETTQVLLGADADIDHGSVVTPVVSEDVFFAQQPKPKTNPAPAAPPKKAVAADAKKPPRRDDEPADEPPPRPRPIRGDLIPDLGLLAFRAPSLRLASVPNMLGDFFSQGGQVTVAGNSNAFSSLPLAGGGRRLKIAENNKALPMNRCYFMYHHFHNAFDSDANTLAPGAEQSDSVDRFTIGLERTFLDDLWSVDVRMPFVDAYQFNSAGLSAEGGSIGDLSISLKRLLAGGPNGSLAAGLGIVMPTGSDVTGQVLTTSYTVHNQAVHLAPYVGLLRVPNDRFFWQGFLQLDIPTGGNRVDYVDTVLPASGSFGTVTDQTLLHADLSAGYWLYRNSDACVVTGLASLAELHYTTTLSDADVVTGVLGPNTYQFGNTFGRVDVMNATVGLHAELISNTTFRVSGAFPMQNNLEKPFDAEVNVSVNRYY